MLRALDENMPANTSVARLTVDDPNGVDDLVYEITAGNSLEHFRLLGSVLETTQPLDFETVSQYSLTFTVRDTVGEPLSKTVTLRVNNLNDKPSIVLTPALVLPGDVVERGFEAGVGLYDIVINDDDWNQQHTVTLSGPNKDYFVYTFKQLTLAKVVGVGAPRELVGIVQVTDNGSPVQSAALTVRLRVESPASVDCDGGTCTGASSGSSQSVDAGLIAAIAVITVLLIVGAVLISRNFRRRRQRKELVVLEKLKTDVRSPFGFNNARWYDMSRPDPTGAITGAPLLLTAGRTGTKRVLNSAGTSSADTDVLGAARADDIVTVRAAMAEEEAAAAVAASSAAAPRRLGRKVTAWFQPADSKLAAALVVKPSDRPGPQETPAFSETSFAAPVENLRMKRRDTIQDMMSTKNAARASRGLTPSLPNEPEMDGFDLDQAADGVDVFELGQDEEEVFDISDLSSL
jgi:hypothetical protein